MRFSSKILVFATLWLIAVATDAATIEEFKLFHFNGRITPESVKNFIAIHSTSGIKKIIITSQGGDMHAGLELGTWVRRLGLDVEVFALCQSACANYVFTAGKKKIIDKEALVLWHGSIEQKKIRELQLKYQDTLSKSFYSQGALSEEDQKFLAEKRIIVESVVRTREQQARFFDLVEVNEHITRLGQEPLHAGVDSWTATVDVMAKFGIVNVEAPPNYGTADYLNQLPLSGLFCGGKCVSYELDSWRQTQRIIR